MKIDLAITRDPLTNEKWKPIRDLVGARHTYLNYVGHAAIRPFKARRSRHRLILLRIGSLTLECGGQIYCAEAGDAVLVPAGEARISFAQCPLSGVLEAEIFEFDQRTLAQRLQDSPGWEELAHGARDVPISPVRFAKLAKIISSMDRQIQTVRRFQAVLGVVFDQYRRGLPEFLRAMFYRPRWKLFMTLEKFVLQADGAAKLAEEYPGGMKQLRRDCRLYIGEPPETVLAKRRFQLATVWVRCDHPIDDVGKALGFASTKEFRCFYAGRKGRSCIEAQWMTPITDLGPEELVEMLRPCWWPKDRPINVRIPGTNDSDIARECEMDRLQAEVDEELRKNSAGQEGENIAATPAVNLETEDVDDADEPKTIAEVLARCVKIPGDPAAERAAQLQSLRAFVIAEHNRDMKYFRAKRERIADDLREKAADFFAMKSTGAEILVPVFGEPNAEEAMAA